MRGTLDLEPLLGLLVPLERALFGIVVTRLFFCSPFCFSFFPAFPSFAYKVPTLAFFSPLVCMYCTHQTQTVASRDDNDCLNPLIHPQHTDMYNFSVGKAKRSLLHARRKQQQSSSYKVHALSIRRRQRHSQA